MSKNKVIKSVSFNVTNADDERMLKAIKRRNFSGYVKKLILADINAKEQTKAENEPVKREIKTEPKKELTASEKMHLMREQMKKAGKKSGH